MRKRKKEGERDWKTENKREKEKEMKNLDGVYANNAINDKR